MEPSDSVSPQVGTETAASWITASTSASASVRQIEVKRKRAELLAKRELELAWAQAEVEAKVKAAEVEAEAKAKAAEAEARFRIEQAKLDAEEELAVLSERGSSVTSCSRRSKIKSVTKPRKDIRAKGGSSCSIIGSKIKSSVKLPVNNDILCNSRPLANETLIKSKIEPISFGQKANDFRTKLEEPELVEATEPINVKDYTNNLTHDNSYGHLNPQAVGFVSRPEPASSNQRAAAFFGINQEDCRRLKAVSVDKPTRLQRNSDGSHRHRPIDPVTNSEFVLTAYLERQGRNEFISLDSQIGFDGGNIAIVFYENQVRRLMDESPYDKRRLEILRASCVGELREMVTLFCAPMKSMTTFQRIEKALDHLRQGYGVSGGLTSEPKVIAIHHGTKISFTSTSLKSLNEDLNTLEVYAYAHDGYHKLTWQLLLDTANRPHNLLKRRYIDYLHRKSLDLNSPSFDSLQEFVVQEIKMSTSDYAQTFF